MFSSHYFSTGTLCVHKPTVKPFLLFLIGRPLFYDCVHGWGNVFSFFLTFFFNYRTRSEDGMQTWNTQQHVKSLWKVLQINVACNDSSRKPIASGARIHTHKLKRRKLILPWQVEYGKAHKDGENYCGADGRVEETHSETWQCWYPQCSCPSYFIV